MSENFLGLLHCVVSGSVDNCITLGWRMVCHSDQQLLQAVVQ